MMKTDMRRRNDLGVVHLAFRDGGFFFMIAKNQKSIRIEGVWRLLAAFCIP